MEEYMTPKHAKHNELKILKNNFQPSQLASANWDKSKCSMPHLRYKINENNCYPKQLICKLHLH